MNSSIPFVVITGGPGAGKTSLVEALSRLGHPVVPESGRAVIRREMTGAGTALPWLDRPAFARAMLAEDRRAFMCRQSGKQWVFFDRGVPDILGYCQVACVSPWPELIHAVRTFRYCPLVFIAPPWRAIFLQDSERRQTFAEAQRTFHAMRQVYVNAGYQLRLLPRDSVAARAAFVLHELARFRQASRRL